MKKILLLLTSVLALVACEKNEVYFTYSPQSPRAGQAVSFSNQTKEGEEWAWSFGDGNTSTSKSPIKTYKTPGEYTVTLKVDNKATRTYSTTITIYDTVPCISVSDTIVRYFEPITLSALAYNPFNYALTYAWELPEGTIILSGETTSNSLKVCFTAPNASLKVRCVLTMDGKPWDLEKTVFVEDQAARAIVLGRSNQLLHQRIFKYGFEEATAYVLAGSDAFVKPSTLVVKGNQLYSFNAINTTDGAIARTDLSSGKIETLIKNGTTVAGEGFEHGYVADGQLYWTAQDAIYSAPLEGTNRTFAGGTDLLLTNASQLGLAAGQTSAGIAIYNGMFIYAYGSGLYRFPRELGTATPIFTDKALKAFAIDAVARKLYFVTAEGLFVSTMEGLQMQAIDAAANGKSVVVNNEDNLLFWTTDKGVRYMPLVQTANNQFSSEVLSLNTIGDISALAVDATERKL